MALPIVRIRYVTGRVEAASVSAWPELPAEGIDWVEIGHHHFTRTMGMSIYWVYREGNRWVMGSGPVGYGALPAEVLVGADDQHEARAIEFMPDLPHSAVKLGWWWPGTTNRPVT